MLEDARFDKNDWEKLGREFGLHPNTLRKIKKENDNDDACLSKCLEDWLNRRDDIEKRHGLPTWKSLVKVLKDIGKKNEAEHVGESITYWLPWQCTITCTITHAIQHEYSVASLLGHHWAHTTCP